MDQSTILKRSAIPLLILLLAFGLRVWGLADHNIWWDEGVSVWAARLPALEAIRWTAQDVHPPLYYLLLHGWWLLVGDGEFVLRFLSALGGVLGVAALYGLGRALGGYRAGLLTALLFTLSRFAVAWSQEIRMYAWAATLAAGALWAAVRLWRGGGWRAWIAYALMTAGGLFTFYLNASVILVANLAFPLVWLREGRPRRSLARWATAQLAVVLFLPWAAYALPQMHAWSSDQPFSPSFFAHLYATMLAVGVPVNIEAYTPLTLLSFSILAIGLATLWATRRSSEQSAGLAMLLAGLLLPALVVYAITIPGNPLYARPLVPRYLLPLAACFYTLLGWGLGALAERRRWSAGLGAALAVAVATSGLLSFYPGRARWDNYTSLAATLQAHHHPGDAVVLHTDKDWPLFAAQHAGPWRGVPYGATMDRTAADALLGPLWEEAEGIWLVKTPDAQRIDPQQAVESWLQAHAQAWFTWISSENGLSFYARTPQRAESLYDLAPGFAPPADLQAEMAPGTTLLGAWAPLPRYGTGDTACLSLYWVEPPRRDATVIMAGETRRETIAAPPPAAHNGPTHQLVDLPLTPDLPGGRYRLLVSVEEGPAVEVGHFTLVRRSPEITASASEIANPLDVHLGQSIRLLGYDLPQTVVEPGGVVELTLYWQAIEPVDARYKVFAHLLGETWNANSGNFLWGQQDNEPVNGQVQTTVWAPGALIADLYRIPVAPDAPPGSYTLEVGMYGLVDGVRLPALGLDGESLGDAIILDQVIVQAP